MTTITSPTPGLTATTHLGPHVLDFQDGTAHVEGVLNEGARAYLLAQGYGIDNAHPAEQQPAAVVVDSRDATGPQQVGTPLRDAAVDPAPGDFLAPVNAGQADPHGPDVVAPGIHAEQGVRPVKGGPVHVGNPAAQDEAETDHAEAATNGGEVTDDIEQPAGNASTEAWRVYALANGASQDDVADATRDELRGQYGTAS